MLLTRRAYLLLLLAAPMLAGGAITSVLTFIALGYLVLLVLMALADFVLAPKPKDFLVRRVNEADASLSLGADNNVAVTLEYRGTRRTQALVRDEYPIEFSASTAVLDARHVVDGSRTTHETPVVRNEHGAWPMTQKPNQFVALTPRTTTTLAYIVRPPRRGDYHFGNTHLRWLGPLGLVIRQSQFATAAGVKVYPNLLDIRRYELLARKGQLAELGFRRRRLLGSGTEFERLRDYAPDDDFRRIDWNAMARKGKPITREYETERSQNIVVLLDVGRLMRTPVNDLAKVDYAINATLMLSYVAGLRGDKVGVLVFADEVLSYLPPKSGKGQFYRLLATLYGIQSQPIEANYARAFAYLGAKHKKRSLIILFTDVASGVAERSVVAQVAPLAARHVPLLVAMSDPEIARLATQPPAASARTYQRAVAEQMLDERAITMRALRQRGVNTLDVPANQLTIEVVNRYLELKSRGRI